MNIKSDIFFCLLWCCLLALLMASCSDVDEPRVSKPDVPEGMVEIRPVLPGMYGMIPREPGESGRAASRIYHENEVTDEKLQNNPVIRLPEGSTVWLIAENASEGENAGKLVKNSYIVYNSEAADKSYLVPCEVDDDGNMTSMEGKPLYLTEGESFKFYVVSPARKLDDALFEQGKVGFQFKNGEYFYANDCRYSVTTPQTITVGGPNSEAVHEVLLSPMMNQTAELKFLISKGKGVHDLDIQPSGVQISGLQNDSPDALLTDGVTPNPYGSPDGIYWHMSQSVEDEPIKLQYGDKSGMLNDHDYTIDAQKRVGISIPVIPMWSISKPVIVVFRLKINGVPSSYEMMLNEKDFKAGYSYGYRGSVSIEDGVSVISWQFVEWSFDVDFPF